jgi:Plectin/S10 domain
MDTQKFLKMKSFAAKNANFLQNFHHLFQDVYAKSAPYRYLWISLQGGSVGGPQRFLCAKTPGFGVHPQLTCHQNHAILEIKELRERTLRMETLLLVSKNRKLVHKSAWPNFVLSPNSRYLTNEGIEYLRTLLHLPTEIVPATLKRAQRSETARPRAAQAPRGDGPRGGEDRSAYRRAPGGGAGGPDKKADVGAGAGDVEFVSQSSWIPTFCRFLTLKSSFFAARWIRPWRPTPVSYSQHSPTTEMCTSVD